MSLVLNVDTVVMYLRSEGSLFWAIVTESTEDFGYIVGTFKRPAFIDLRELVGLYTVCNSGMYWGAKPLSAFSTCKSKSF